MSAASPIQPTCGFEHEFNRGINFTSFQLSHLTVMASRQSGREEPHLGGAVYCSNLKILPLDEIVEAWQGWTVGQEEWRKLELQLIW